MVLKKIKLVTHHSSWWKKKKFRSSSASKLLRHRKLGWKLINKALVIKKANSVETRTFTKYILKIILI